MDAASAHVRPRAQAGAGWMMKRVGSSAVQTAAVLEDLTGIAVTPGGVVHATQRLGTRGKPTDHPLREGVRPSAQVSPDETGWLSRGTKPGSEPA